MPSGLFVKRALCWATLAASVVAARACNPGDIRQESLSLLGVIADEPLPSVTTVVLPLTGPSFSDDDLDGAAAADPFAISTSCGLGAVRDTFAADLAWGGIMGPRDNLRDVIPVPACPLLLRAVNFQVCRGKKPKIGLLGVSPVLPGTAVGGIEIGRQTHRRVSVAQFPPSSIQNSVNSPNRSRSFSLPLLLLLLPSYICVVCSTMPAQTLLSFRAGKMSRENDTSDTVIPDERKGYIQLINEDDLLHFQWKERSALDPEDDLIIFPDDAKFIRVTEAVDGRVYMLRFESSKAKHFFWMQVPNSPLAAISILLFGVVMLIMVG